ncbi:unnamed protein product [Cyprideis torosa]|uniref:Uncharacterized protein n=1 Tax=Cyprideis torosa TaxID=163714 RepID=A0A7R8W9A7_9CRUS|nr:unnamed protein product [Cyprideis torosa]CAG0889540.1 unnamed protein product [Cyprideis torosa]
MLHNMKVANSMELLNEDDTSPLALLSQELADCYQSKNDLAGCLKEFLIAQKETLKDGIPELEIPALEPARSACCFCAAGIQLNSAFWRIANAANAAIVEFNTESSLHFDIDKIAAHIVPNRKFGAFRHREIHPHTSYQIASLAHSVTEKSIRTHRTKSQVWRIPSQRNPS